MTVLLQEKPDFTTSARVESQRLATAGNAPIIAVVMVGNENVPLALINRMNLLPENSTVFLTCDGFVSQQYQEFGAVNISASARAAPLMKPATGSAETLLSGFIDFLRKKQADKTVRGYRSDVRNVLNAISKAFFDEIPLDELDLSAVTLNQVEEVEQALFKESDSKPATLNRLKAGWNRFCVFIGKDDWRFSEKVNWSPEYKEDIITNDEVQKMLAHCREQREAAKSDAERIRWYRKEISILLGWEMGFRSCEYGSATFDEVERGDKITIKNSKHNGYRTVAVTNDTKTAILEFKAFLQTRDLFPKDGGIFEKRNGEKYSTSTFRRCLRKTAEACKVAAKYAKTHGLRHRFAKNFYVSSFDEIMLGRIMGHKSSKTTRHYAAPTFEDQKGKIQRCADIARGKIILAA